MKPYYFSSTTAFYILGIALFCIMGCSGNLSSYNAIATQLKNSNIDYTDNLPASTIDITSSISLMGAFELTISDDCNSAELIPMRSSTVGESFIVSGLNYFVKYPCADCLKIKGIKIIGGNPALTFHLRHPFEPGDPSKPPYGKNRLDLDVFDVALLVKPKNKTHVNLPLMGVNVYTDVLANPAGYTRELAEVIGDTAAIPFCILTTDTLTYPYNKFPMGGQADLDVIFNLTPGNSPLSFDLYLTISYGASAKKADRLNPKYYNPEFNRKAAWKVDVTPLGIWDPHNSLATVEVKVEVYDWQVGATVYPNPADFANAPPDNVYARSEVASVSVEIPGMTSTLQTVTTPVSGTGMPGDPLIFIIPVANANLLPEGEYTSIVRVLDERACLAVPDGRDIIIDTPDGKAINYYPMPEYATYQIFKARVSKSGSLMWAKRGGGIYWDTGTGVTSLSDNSIVLTGPFNETAIFGDDEPTPKIISSKGMADVFIAKYSSNLNLMWVKQAGGTSEDRSFAISRLTDDSFAIIGTFGGPSIAFGEPSDPNYTVLNIIGDQTNMFMARYDSNGQILWAKQASSAWPSKIAALSDNSIVVCGSFQGTAIFGPGEPNETKLTAVSIIGTDFFIARYNPNGILAWAKKATVIDDPVGYIKGNGITSLSDNSSVVTGYYHSHAIFGEGEPNETILTASGYDNYFIARYNSNGTLAWAKRAADGEAYGRALTTLPDDTFVATGEFKTTTIFGAGEPNQTTLHLFGRTDIFIAKYNPNGSLVWVKSVGGTDWDYGSNLSSFSYNSIVLTGRFEGSCTFGISEPNETTLNSAGKSDIFIAKYYPNGTLAWAKRAGGEYADIGFDVTKLFCGDSIVVSGAFSADATFGPGEPNETQLHSAGQSDMFVARYSP